MIMIFENVIYHLPIGVGGAVQYLLPFPMSNLYQQTAIYASQKHWKILVSTSVSQGMCNSAKFTYKVDLYSGCAPLRITEMDVTECDMETL